jgi:hypothetical protein
MDDLDILIEKATILNDDDIFSKLIVPEVERSPITSNVENKELNSEDSPYSLSLRRKEFVDDKDRDRFIGSVERMVRNSPEYKLWTEYLRETLGEYVCALTGEVHAHTSVDIHHHPITLYHIVKGMILKYQNSEKEFCSYDISKDVIELHYQNRVGYLPLVHSLHDKFHNGFLQLPMELIHGDWKYLLKNLMYDDDDLETIQSRTVINKKNCGYTSYNWVDNKEDNK